MNSIDKKLSAFVLGAVLALGVGVGVSGVKSVGAKAEDDPLVYTLTPVAGTNNSYAGNCDIEVNKVTWNVNANTQGEGEWWRFGGKKITDTDRYFYSKTAINYNISKIEVEIGTYDSKYNLTVNSFTLSVFSTLDDVANKTSAVSTVTGDFAYGSTVTFNRPDDTSWEGMFYRFTFNVTNSGSSNKNVQFNGAKFYGTEPVKPLIEITNPISENLEINATGTLTATTQNITDPVITWTSSNPSVVEIESATGVYTAKAGGAATITASATGTGVSEPATASFDVAVNYGLLKVADLISLTEGFKNTYTAAYKVTVRAYIVDLTSVSNSFVISDDKEGTTDGNKFNVYQIWSSHALRDIAIVNGQVTFTGNPATYNGTAQLTNITYSDYTDGAIEFGTSFLSKTKTPCADPTKDNSEALEAVWSELKTAYDALDSYAQAKVKSTVAKASGGSELEEAVARYDHIVDRYSLTDFIGRVSTSASNYQDRANANNSFVIVLISIMSVMALAGTATLVIIKKRKSR